MRDAHRLNRISVALCTYNGEEFLPRQLASIENQTRLPDEAVICDDRSSDGTVDILSKFAASASFPVKIILNEENLGSTRNFERTIRACNGDLIALSDQDDLWYPMRLERSEQELLAHPEAGLVFSDADTIDAQDRPLPTRMWASFGFTEALKRSLLAGDYDLCVRRRFVTGATVMFRTALRDRILPVGPGWLHDEWIAATVGIFADLRPIGESLIGYRQHALQQLGPNLGWGKKRKLWAARWSALSSHEGASGQWDILRTQVRALEALCDFFAGMPLDEKGHRRLSSYRSYLQFLLLRFNLPAGRLNRLSHIGSNLRIYMEYARLGQLAKDLLISRS